MHFTFKRGAANTLYTPVSNSFIINELPTAPDGYVKAYLYGLMCCSSGLSSGMSEDMASALNMSDAELANAFTYWQGRGLVRVIATDPPTIEYSAPHAAFKTPTREAAPFVKALQEALGSRMLSGSELERIYDWRDIFGMDEAAVIMLVRYCIELKGARVSVKYMDEAARSWADAGVLTAEAAARHIERSRELASGAERILRRWRKSRRPTEDELNMYSTWLSWGFDDEAITAACAAMAGVNEPSFRYLNGVLESWRFSGAVDAAAIQQLQKEEAAAHELARLLFERAGLKRRPTQKELEQLRTFKDSWHMDTEVMLLAAEAVQNSAAPFAGLKRLLTKWHDMNISTVAAAKAELAQPSVQPTARKNRFSAISQRSYSADQLKEIGISLIDDDE